MKIAIATENDIQNITEIVELCTKDLENQGIYQWNEHYPTLNHIKESVQDKSMYILKENKNCVGTISITEKQPLKYEDLDWSDKTGPIMVITKLIVNPTWQKQGIGRKLMDFAENYALEKNILQFALMHTVAIQEPLIFMRKGNIKK